MVNKKKNSHRKKRRRNLNNLKVILPVAAAAVLIVVVTAVFLVNRNGGKEVQAGAAAETTRQSEAEETESTQTQTESQPEEGFTPDETETGAADGKEFSRPVPQENVAAEVGSMDDEQDPQASTKTAAGGDAGAAVDVGEVSSPAAETGTATLGIDVSKYQGTIDWAAVKAAGVDFAMIRVGYRTKATGIIYEDPGARYNLQEATKNGIKAGAYFFSSAINEQEAKEEAAWVSSFIAKYKITYPVAYNCEDFQSADSRQYGLSKEERTKIACAFLDGVASAGYTPMFYASRNEMEQSAQWDMATLGSRYKVWVSQYPQKPFPETPTSSYSGTHAMWQYTSQGQVAGIKSKVDVNVAYFGYSQEAEAKDASPAEIVEANPEVGMNFTEVNETVTAKDETNLRNIPTTEGSTVVYKLKNGETARRTGVGSNGWDRIIYNGQRLYAVHSFLTTDLNKSPADTSGESDSAGDTGAKQSDGAKQPEAGQDTVSGMTFQTVNEAVTARDKVNLRDLPGTENGKIVGTLSYGEAVVRTGVSGSADTGWSRLLVNGQTVYASSRLLATSMDFKEKEKPTVDNPEAGMRFTAASGTVKAKSGETNLRTLPTTNEPSQAVGQLTGDVTAQRIAVDTDKGWTKLSWNGQIVYAVSNYLTVVE